jgi:hypothetical protein
MSTLTITFVVAIAALAWVAFAEHPTAANLRAALTDTLPLL